MVVGNGSICLGVDPIEIWCNSSDGFCFEGHIVTQMVVDSVEVSSSDCVMPLGKVDRVATPISLGIFLAAALYRMMVAGLVDFRVYGVDKAGSGSKVHLNQGLIDKCTRQIGVTNIN